MTIIEIWRLVALATLLLIMVLDLLLRRDGFTLTDGLDKYALVCIVPILHLFFALSTVVIIFDLITNSKQDRIHTLEQMPEFAVRL